MNYYNANIFESITKIKKKEIREEKLCYNFINIHGEKLYAYNITTFYEIVTPFGLPILYKIR